MSATTVEGPGRRAGAVPGRRVVAPAPRQRMVAAAPGRRPVLRVVPPLRAAEHERPALQAPVPRAGTEQRVRPAAPAAPVLRAGAEQRVRPAAPAARARASARPRTRLTRRGRIVVSALAISATLLVVVLAWLAGTATAEAARSGAPASGVYRNLTPVVVRPGETLWAIATQAEPTADPRSVIQEIVDINALSGTSIQPGQRLWVPRG
jgi:nucleoid-associated protein YgaU